MWQNRNKIKVVEPGEMDQTILTEAGIIFFFLNYYKKIKKMCRSPNFRVLTQPLPSVSITWSPTQFGLRKTYYQTITMTYIYEM